MPDTPNPNRPDRAPADEDSHPLEPGTNPENVRRVTPEEAKRLRAMIDETYDLQPISVKVPGPVLDAFETLADDEGIGAKALIRQVLIEYVTEHTDDD